MKTVVKEAQVLYDTRGNQTHVVLPIRKYEKLMELLEDVEDIRFIRAVENEKRILWSEVKKRLRKKS